MSETVTNTPTILYPGVGIPALFERLFDSVGSGTWGRFLETLESWWDIYSIIAILFSLLFLTGFIYAKIRLGQLWEINEQNLRDAEKIWAARHETGGTHNVRWNSIQQKVSENNPESWKIAIIEADIMLDEVLTDAGYVGQSLGEKLKSANPESFTTIQDAWDAHKVRNEIAHVGGDFVLTQKTARETLVRFERVFREFGVF